jgi:CheY-like chemotaxis protein
MPKGGQLIIESRPFYFEEISLSLSPGSRKGAFACISVTDSGTGITAEILPRIFEPFFTTKDVDKGTGLGLSTVYGLVEQHNGWINVYSEMGQGTKFNIYLPLITNNVVTQTESANKAFDNEKGKTILLVEDEASLRDVINIMLIDSGYKVLQARDGINALKIWSDNTNKIDLMLTDLFLSKEMSGKELADHILRQNPKIKVIYMSAFGEEIAVNDLQLKEGVNFLQKPFESSQLADILRYQLVDNRAKLEVD